MISPKVINQVPIFKKLVEHDLHGGTITEVKSVVNPLAWYAYLQKTSHIPVKSTEGKITDTNGFVILPNVPNLKTGEDVFTNLQNVNKKLDFMIYTAPNQRVDMKIKQTKDLIVRSIRIWEKMKMTDLF